MPTILIAGFIKNKGRQRKMAEKKSQAEQLKEKLFYVKKHATLVMSEQEEKKGRQILRGL